jgi:hypothetical protein
LGEFWRNRLASSYNNGLSNGDRGPHKGQVIPKNQGKLREIQAKYLKSPQIPPKIQGRFREIQAKYPKLLQKPAPTHD